MQDLLERQLALTGRCLVGLLGNSQGVKNCPREDVRSKRPEETAIAAELRGLLQQVVGKGCVLAEVRIFGERFHEIAGRMQCGKYWRRPHIRWLQNVYFFLVG